MAEKKDVVNYDEENLDSEQREDYNAQFIRAEREDDDGYDPYSDRIEFEPMFQEDPWD